MLLILCVREKFSTLNSLPVLAKLQKSLPAGCSPGSSVDVVEVVEFA